jgi:hypothetical protein
MNDLAAEILKNTGGDTRANSASSSFSVNSAGDKESEKKQEKSSSSTIFSS